MTAPIHPAIDGYAWGVLPCTPMQPALRVIHSSEIVPDPGTWVLTEEQVPESNPHEILSDHLKHLLLWRAKEVGWDVHIGRNIAFRWDAKHPQYGLDPDVYMVEPPPPEGVELMSLLLCKRNPFPIHKLLRDRWGQPPDPRMPRLSGGTPRPPPTGRGPSDASGQGADDEPAAPRDSTGALIFFFSTERAMASSHGLGSAPPLRPLRRLHPGSTL